MKVQESETALEEAWEALRRDLLTAKQEIAVLTGQRDAQARLVRGAVILLTAARDACHQQEPFELRRTAEALDVAIGRIFA